MQNGYNFSKYLIFSKKKEEKTMRNKQNYFLKFWFQQGSTSFLSIFIQNEKSRFMYF